LPDAGRSFLKKRLARAVEALEKENPILPASAIGSGQIEVAAKFKLGEKYRDY
jgi:hypothetical protein